MADRDEQHLKLVDPESGFPEEPDTAETHHFPKSHGWMDGRSVFWRPESRPSTVTQRDIIQNESERAEVSQSYVESVLERRQLNANDLEAELREVREIAEARAVQASGGGTPDYNAHS